jgi:hypothetical protein
MLLVILELHCNRRLHVFMPQMQFPATPREKFRYPDRFEHRIWTGDLQTRTRLGKLYIWIGIESIREISGRSRVEYRYKPGRLPSLNSIYSKIGTTTPSRFLQDRIICFKRKSVRAQPLRDCYSDTSRSLALRLCFEESSLVVSIHVLLWCPSNNTLIFIYIRRYFLNKHPGTANVKATIR